MATRTLICPKCNRVQDVDLQQAVKYYCKVCSAKGRKVEMKPLPVRQQTLFPTESPIVHQGKLLEGGAATTVRFKQSKVKPLPPTTREAVELQREMGVSGLRKFGVQTSAESIITADDPNKVVLHGVTKTRWRCKECQRAYHLANGCRIHGQGGYFDIATYQGADRERIVRDIIVYSLMAYFGQKEHSVLSYEQMQQDIGIEVPYLINLLDSPPTFPDDTYATWRENLQDVYDITFHQEGGALGYGSGGITLSLSHATQDLDRILSEGFGRYGRQAAESVSGVYFYRTGESAMQDYYTKNGESILTLTLSFKQGEILDLTRQPIKSQAIAAIRAYIQYLKNTMPGYVMYPITDENYWRHPYALEKFIRDNWPNTKLVIVPHKGYGLPTTKQYIIIDIPFLNERIMKSATNPNT